MSKNTHAARRDFLKRFGAVLGAGTAASLFPQLRMMESALAQAAGGYKALVCVYLAGGNDAYNWLLPTDAKFSTYQASRGLLALNRTQIGTEPFVRDLDSAATPIGTFGIHSSCSEWVDPQGVTRPGLKQLFDSGRSSFIANIGTLVQPTTKADVSNPAIPKPPQLYSHNDQTSLWQVGATDSQRKYGWGGLVADRLFGTAQGGSMPILMSLSGNRFSVGQSAFPYLISTGGATTLSGFSQTSAATTTEGQRRLALDALIDADQMSHLFQKEYGTILRRSIDLSGLVTNNLATVPNSAAPFNLFPVGTGATYNSLADQLRMVAKLIATRSLFSHQRQIFFVQIGGFDIHDRHTTQQPVLLGRVSQALGAFQTALEQLGVDGNVTTFTMSEFARTLNPNGTDVQLAGSDHAWGSVQCVVGKSDVIRGGRVFGTYPSMMLNGPDSFSRGQFVPTTSVDQMCGPMAEWMGVAGGDLPNIFPNISNFTPTTLNLYA